MNRKGISPLIATVLLIAFTIAVGGIISVWLTQFARTQTDVQNDNVDRVNTCTDAIFSFSKSDLNTSGSYIWITLSNDGSTNYTDFDIYVQYKNGSFGSNTTPNGGPSSTSPLQPGQKAFLNATHGAFTWGARSDLDAVTVTLGPNDQCAGKSYKVTF